MGYEERPGLSEAEKGDAESAPVVKEESKEKEAEAEVKTA